MSWSFALQNGDLVLSGTQFATVTGGSKLLQDMRCAVLETMGTDDMHPEFGSLIDGGVMPDGTPVTSVIGMRDWQQAASIIQAELQRLATNYQSQQLTRAQADRTVYNRISLTPDEALVSLSNVTFQQNQDALIIAVTFTTAAGDDLNVVFPVPTNS